MCHIQNETPLTAQYASPKFAEQLHHLGLTDNTLAFWIRSTEGDHIQSFAYDPDDYYRKSFEFAFTISDITKPKTIPAYSLTELEKLIPGYTIEFQNGWYHIMLAAEYGQAEALSPRLPDAFALLTKAMLQQRLLNIDHANQQFTIKKLPHGR